MPVRPKAVPVHEDYLIEHWKRSILNRIDQEWTCDAIIGRNYLVSGIPVYCGLPEHDPFTNRCRDHTAGHM